jgi:hypothetical protein
MDYNCVIGRKNPIQETENGIPISQQKIVINKQENGITLMFAKYECGTSAHMNIAV